MEKDKSEDKKERVESKKVIVRENHAPIAGTILVLLLIIGVLCAILLIPYKTITSKEAVPYTAIEEYYGTEPYLTTTQVKEKVPVESSKCDYQTPSYYIDTTNTEQGDKRGVSCSILNFASLPTDFIYYIYNTDASGRELNRTSEKRVTVNPQDMFLTTELVPIASGYGCHVKPQVRVECTDIVKFTETTKDQLAVRERQVVKYRTVTKYRTDTLYKQVNMFFDYQMPWQKSWKEEGVATYYLPIKTG